MQPSAASNSGPQQPRLLDQLRDRLQQQHVSPDTVTQYLHWARAYILFHGIRHPRELGREQVQAFLDHLAAGQPEAVGPARLALRFLYEEILQRPLRDLSPAPVGPVPPHAAAGDQGPPAAPPSPRSPRLLDQVRDLLRVRHYSLRTEECYVRWITQFILFHNKRHPRDMGAAEIEHFLTFLAVDQHVSASTQNQA